MLAVLASEGANLGRVRLEARRLRDRDRERSGEGLVLSPLPRHVRALTGRGRRAAAAQSAAAGAAVSEPPPAADPAVAHAPDPPRSTSPPCTPTPGKPEFKGITIAKKVDESLKDATSIKGAIGAALVGYTSGMTLGTAGGGTLINLDVAAAGNTEVVRAKMATMKQLDIGGTIEDILITLEEQLHLIRPIDSEREEGCSCTPC